jgi:hypothetical protein
MEPDDGGGNGGDETMLQPDPGGHSAEEWFAAIGEFVIAFERLCSFSRFFITGYLPGKEQADWDCKTTVVRLLGARQLRDTVEALLARTGKLSPSYASALKDFEALITTRNKIVHADWSFFPHDEDSDAEVSATAIVARVPTRKPKGEAWEERSFTFEQVRAEIARANDIYRRLFALGFLCYANFPSGPKD